MKQASGCSSLSLTNLKLEQQLIVTPTSLWSIQMALTLVMVLALTLVMVLVLALGLAQVLALGMAQVLAQVLTLGLAQKPQWKSGCTTPLLVLAQALVMTRVLVMGLVQKLQWKSGCTSYTTPRSTPGMTSLTKFSA